jgi:SAM-dependent methyltransferase
MIVKSSLNEKILEVVENIRLDIRENSELNLSNNLLDYIWEETLDFFLKNINNEKISDIFQDKDPMGQLYEFFFSHELKVDKGQFKIGRKSQSQREKGKVYTPFQIITLINDILRDIILNKSDFNKKSVISIADISCGTGRFLTEWAMKWDDPIYKTKINYSGFDIDGGAIRIAKKNNIKNCYWSNDDVLIDNKFDKQDLFDIIIGNPPYIESRSIPDEYWQKLKDKYRSAHKKFDLSVVFLEKTLQLLRPNGWAGLIITNKWLVSDYGAIIRRILLEQTSISYIIDVSELKIFEQISTYPVIIIFQKLIENKIKENIGSNEIIIAKPTQIAHLNRDFMTQMGVANKRFPILKINQSFFNLTPNNVIISQISKESIEILTRIWNLPVDSLFTIGDVHSPYELRKGIHTGNIRNKIFVDKSSSNSHLKQAITSRNKVERYKISWGKLWINYDPEIIRRDLGEYASFREPWIFKSKPKIVIKLFGLELQAAMDHNGYYANNSLILLVEKNRNGDKLLNFKSLFESIEEEFYYLLGILNSKIISQYYNIIFSHTHVRGKYLQYYIKDLNNIPIIRPTPGNIDQVKKIARIAHSLESLYSKNKSTKHLIPSNIRKNSELSTLEQEINSKISKLYGF